MHIDFYKYKSQFLNLGVYMMASIVPMVFSIIINPLIALNMSPADYATVGYYSAFNILITPLINFYLMHYYTKKYYELSHEELVKLKAVIVRSLIVFSFVISIIVLLGLYFYTIVFNTESEIPFSPYAIVSVMSIPLLGIYSLNLVDYRMAKRSRSFFYLSISYGFLTVILNLLFVVILKYGAIGKLSSVLIANFIIFIYCVWSNIEIFRIRFDKKIFLDALKFSFPLVIAAMLSFFSDGYDKIALERMGDVVELGYYVVGAQIAGYLTIFSTSIDNTFQPDIFKSIVQRDFKKCAKIISVKIGLLIGIVALFVIFASSLIDILTAGKYVDSTKYSVIISLSSISSMLYHSFSQVTIALGLTGITLLNKIIGSILCIGMYTFLIKQWGPIGAAWGTVISYLLFFCGNVCLVLIKHKLSRNSN